MPKNIPTISLETLNRIAAIDEFKGRWQSLGQLLAGRLKALQRLANMESAAAAARMEGIRVSDRQIGEFLTDKPDSRLSRDARSVVNGFHLVLKLINDSSGQISFIESHVLQMHGLLMNNSHPTEITDAKRHKRLTDLIENTKTLIAGGQLHPLLIISDFSSSFRHLRPFPQGNNRLTWLLTQLLLLRCGYNFLPYGSIVRFLEKRLADHQSTLLFATNRAMAKPAPQIWLDLFLNTMVELQENITAKIQREKKLLRLSAPLLEIIRIVQENGQANIAQILLTTSTNRNTLKVRLRKLVADKYLLQSGRGKSTEYHLPELHQQ
jgi:Fic family protein